MKNIIEILKEQKGYIEYKGEAHQFITLLQKKINSGSVCETNGSLSIKIGLTTYDNEGIVHEGFKVSITAEKHSKWWNLECYSLNRYELLEQIDELEAKLVEIFNVL